MRSTYSAVELTTIRIPVGRRALDRAVVDRLKRSIARLGLMVPISICERADLTAEDLAALEDVPPRLRKAGVSPPPPAYDLVAGLHRYQACFELGHERIAVRIEHGAGPESAIDGDEERAIDMRLWEISENLDRAELTPLERSEQIAEWVRLADDGAVEKLDGQVSGQFAQKLKTGRPEGGISAAARELGVERTEVRRAIKRAERIAPAVKEAIRGNPAIAGSGVELDALAALPPEAQTLAVAAVEGGEAKTVRAAAADIRRRISRENPDAPTVAPPTRSLPDGSSTLPPSDSESLGLTYLTAIPVGISPDQVIVHNNVAPTRRLGSRGFRAWLQPPSDKLILCECGWAPELDLHYRAPPPASDPVERIMLLIDGLSIDDFARLQARFHEFCGARLAPPARRRRAKIPPFSKRG